MKDNQSGRSMMEMLGVIAIIGILTVGGIAGYSKAMEMWRVNRAANQISYILAHLRALYGAQMDYRGLDSENSPKIIDKSKAFPPEMGSNGDYKNPFAGSVKAKVSGRYVSATVDDGNGGTVRNEDKLAFILTYEGIPRSACISLSTIDWGTGTAGGLIALGINYAGIKDVTAYNCLQSTIPAAGSNLGSAVACEGNGVLSPADASIACSSESSNTIYFKFY